MEIKVQKKVQLHKKYKILKIKQVKVLFEIK
jgi:hypothetical protein